MDTNIVSAHLRGDAAVGAQIQASTRLHMPVTVLGKLYAERYGKVKARLAQLGSMIPENDLWIAATCLVHDLTLASRDAHFEAVEGLRQVRWESNATAK